MADGIGWIATALFLASYSCKDQRKLRMAQAAAALVWVVYGLILHAVPIIVANLLVAVAAVYSSVAAERQPTEAASAVGVKRVSEPDLSRIS
jgi:Bacterial inner membrane protein